jgi:hypothetical protein
MTDTRRRRQASAYTRYSVFDDEAAPSRPPAAKARPEPTRPARRKTGVAGRVVAAGVGLAAMVGLVANMEIAGRHAEAATAAAATVPASKRTATSAQKAAPVRYAAARTKKQPIVLTPHTAVHTVSAPASSGGGYVASAPAAAPVASTGGS